MKIFKIVANTAAIASIASIAVETGSYIKRNVTKSARTAVAVKDVKDLTGDSMLNKPSEKHNSMKKAVREAGLTTGLYRIGGAVLGFVGGIMEGIRDNEFTLGFSIMTLAAKGRIMKTIGAVGMGISLTKDFIKNGTNIFTKKDMIEK